MYSDDYVDYRQFWQVRLLAWVGRRLGIQFKIDGLPFGAEYRASRFPFKRPVESGCCANKPQDAAGKKYTELLAFDADTGQLWTGRPGEPWVIK